MRVCARVGLACRTSQTAGQRLRGLGRVPVPGCLTSACCACCVGVMVVPPPASAWKPQQVSLVEALLCTAAAMQHPPSLLCRRRCRPMGISEQQLADY
jgi:hypothetical protein